MTAARTTCALLVAGLVAWALAPDRRLEQSAPARARDATPPAPETIRIAQIELSPEPPPERAKKKPRPQPKPATLPARGATPTPPEPPEPKPVAAAALKPEPEPGVRGEALLRAGAFPRLRASYARIGFERYRDAVLALGGRFFLFDDARRQPVAEVDPRTGRIQAAGSRAGLSHWPRDVTRHLADALERGRARYGSVVTRVILLPPAKLDATLLGALDAHLRQQALGPGDLARVDVAYELRAGRLHCDVLAVALRDGSERPMALTIDLSGGHAG